MSLKTFLTDIFKPKDFKVLEPKEPKETQTEKVEKIIPYHHHKEDEKLIAIEMIAQGLTNGQVIKELERNYSLKFRYSDIQQFRRGDKWRPIIKELKDKFDLEADCLDASKKHVRVRRMESIFDESIVKGKTREAISAHTSIQKEYEKDGDTINLLLQNNSLYQQFNSLSPEELLKRQKEATLKLKELKTELKGAENGPDRTTEENKK